MASIARRIPRHVLSTGALRVRHDVTSASLLGIRQATRQKSIRTSSPPPLINNSGNTNNINPFPVVQRNMRIIVGVAGATGTIFAVRLLELLCTLSIETHLIISKWAQATLKYEMDGSITPDHLASLATCRYTIRDLSAPPASGSFQHDGMIVVPCSMKTLAAIRAGYCDDLIARSADVCLKEPGRRLVLVVRETPLSVVHLENMLAVQRAGATIFPPVPAFYTRPRTIRDLVDQSVGRMLDGLGIHVEGAFERWEGMRTKS